MQISDFVKDMKPLFNYVKLRKVTQEEMKAGALILPDSDNKEYPEYFEVLDVGPGTDDGESCPCKIGDKVLVSGPAIAIKGALRGECFMAWIYLVSRLEEQKIIN